MSELDFFGYAATAFILLGTYFSIDKDYYGWALRLFGSLIWAYVGIRIGMVSLWVSEGVFALMAYYGYRQWKIQDNLEKHKELLEELANWQIAGMHGWQQVDGSGKDYVEPLSGQEIRDELGITLEDMKEVNETVKREKQGKKMAAKRSHSRKKSVRSARGRRSVKTNGKSRSRPNAKSRSSKKSRRNI